MGNELGGDNPREGSGEGLGEAYGERKKRVGDDQQGLPTSAKPTGEKEGKYEQYQQGEPEGENTEEGKTPGWAEYLYQHSLSNGELDASTSWEGFFRSQNPPEVREYYDLYSTPQSLEEWTTGFTTNHVTEVNKETGISEHTFYFSAGLHTYRLSRLTNPLDYNLLSSLPKFTQVKIDTKRYNAGEGAGITNISAKSIYVHPKEAMEITTLGELIRRDKLPKWTISHSLYNPRHNRTNGKQGRLCGKVDMLYPEGRCIQVFQLSAPTPNSLVKEERWTPLGPIPRGMTRTFR